MADVKLLASQRLNDNPDGGGLMTSTEIVDGVINNLWPDISRVDRAYGVVNLRKLYVKADTPDTALYSGLHVICLMPPQDPRVTVTMFSTNNWADVRTDAQSAVERYLDESVPTRMIPYDRQLAGQRTILVYQRPELDLPNIGEVYVLCTLDDATLIFFRVQAIDQSVQTFVDVNGQPFQARVITMTITEPLPQTIQGSQPNKFFVPDANTSKVRKTIVSDAVNYHCVHALAADAAIGDLTIKLDSVFTQLVPSSTSESALIDITPTQAVAVIPSANPPAVNVASALLTALTVYSSVAIKPGTVQCFHHLGGGSTLAAIDDGAGNMIAGTSVSGTVIGAVDYATGVFTFTTPIGGVASTCDYFAVPAAAVGKLAQTFQQPVTQSTRGFVYVATLNPLPTAGSVQVSFCSLGRWYTLIDDGSGALVGDVGVGSGSVNFATGTCSVSLGALPDIGSSIIFAWGGNSEYEIKTGDVAISTPVVTGTLAHPANPGSLTVTWTAGGVTKTATDSNGLWTGDAVGDINYNAGTFRIKPTLLPDPTTVFSFTYSDQSASAPVSESFTPTASGGSITVTSANAPLRTGSVQIEYWVVDSLGLSKFTLHDDANGHLIDGATGFQISGASVNYTTGVIVLPTSGTVYFRTAETWVPYTTNMPARTVDAGTGYYSATSIPTQQVTSASSGTMTWNYDASAHSPTVIVHSVQSGSSVTSHTETFNSPPLSIDLTPLTSNRVVPGGVMFTLAGRTYIDRAGSLYYAISSTTNSGTLGGSIDYGSGIATVTSWVGGSANTLTLQALLTQVQPLPIYIITGHTPGLPLRPASFYIQANQLDGTLVSATADVDGNISTSAMHGYVDVNNGVFSVAFGAYVLDSSLTSGDKAQPWYNSSNVLPDGYIWRPNEVLPDTIRYNAVVEVSTPLDSTILGIDPVRLPLDGRVQAVRDGYMLILHDAQVYTMPGALTAGQVVTLPRGSLALVEVRDQTGALVPGQVAGGPTVTGAKYTADLSAGTITMASPLDLTGFTQPLVATHRIEDAGVVTDIEITGQVTIAQALTHAYTAANSLASTALIAPFVGGSVQAAANHFFTQQTWNSSQPNWTDAVIGSGTTANFDLLDYPIQVLNRDAITEKWALVFTSATAFNIVAQDLGVIGTGNTSTDVSPLNPATGNPYFFLDHRGFGSGWATGNAIRFDTQGAGFPIWLARTVKSGPATYTDDRNVIEPRWDKS